MECISMSKWQWYSGPDLGTAHQIIAGDLVFLEQIRLLVLFALQAGRKMGRQERGEFNEAKSIRI